MKNITIIQLTRIGDLLQTFYAAYGLKIENPKIVLHLIAREQFAAPIRYLLDEIFDEITYLPNLHKSENATKAEFDVKKLVDNESLKNIDVLVNLSFCKSSSILTQLIEAKHKLGIMRNDKNELIIQDQWSQFVYSQVLGSELCSFNLVDLYRNILGVGLHQYPVSQEADRDQTIVVHPFASTLKKRWGIHKWIECLYQILSSHQSHTVYIVGSDSEKQKVEEIIHHALLSKFSSRLKNVAGICNFKQVDTLLSRCSLFIGHDSAVSHLAAKSQTKSLVISLGTVRPYESSPYNPHALIVSPKIDCFPCTPSEKCDLLPCHTKIVPSTISNMANSILSGTEIDSTNLTNADLFAVQIDQALGFDLKRINKASQLTADMYRRFYKILWSYQISETEFFEPFPELSNDLIQSIEKTSHGIEKLYQLYQHAIDFTQNLAIEAQSKSINLPRIKEFAEYIKETDELAQLIRHSFHYLAPIIDFTFTQKTSFSGPTLLDIAAGHIYSYEKAMSSLMILTELMSKSIESSNNLKKTSRKSSTNLDL